MLKGVFKGGTVTALSVFFPNYVWKKQKLAGHKFTVELKI